MSESTSNGGASLPKGWERPLLSKIAEINPALDRCIIDDKVEVTFVPMRAVEPDGGGLLRPEIRPFGSVKKGYTPFLSGDVIMAKITPCMENGKTTVVPQVPDSVCFGSTEFHVVRAEGDIEPRWIANFLLQHDTRRAAQRAMGGGVGQMRVPISFLEAVHIPLAPAAEQTRIADTVDELLSDLDAGVAALQQVRAKLKLYRASVLKAAVEGTLSAEWRTQHPNIEPAAELLKRILDERRRRWEEEQLRKFKEKGKEPPKEWKAKYKEPVSTHTTDLSLLPNGWRWASCNELAWTAGYGTSVKCTEESKGLAVLRIPNILGGGVDLENLKFAPHDYIESESELVHTGDLLVIRTNGSRNLIGKGAVVTKEPSLPLSFASYLIRLRLVQGYGLPEWFRVLWGSSSVRQWIETHAATSAGQHNISLNVLETLLVPLPPIPEQEAIVEAVEDQFSIIDHLEADIEAKLTSTQGLRQSILRHAFTGKLVPQDSNDEPASELLKGIAAEREGRAREAAAAKLANSKPRASRKREVRKVPRKKGSASRGAKVTHD